MLLSRFLESVVDEEKRSRRRGSWAERREGDSEEVRFQALQRATGQTKEPSRWPSLQGGTDGTTPNQGLVTDNAGNLYGTTYLGGTNNDGTVFELSPSEQGWSKTTIYNASEGLSPLNTGVMTFDQFGDLYGETQGTIFELTSSNGVWSASTVFQFSGTDGNWPNGALIFDESGSPIK
jgi:uncharacterized repeat protein (TIGR03803 family)